MEQIYEFIMNLVISNGVIIAVATFILGQILKTISEKTTNYIPLLGGFVGILLGIFMPNIFPKDPIITRAIYGLALGWASTGGYETIKQLKKKSEKK